jgi:DME family drug/metabolite transporter
MAGAFGLGAVLLAPVLIITGAGWLTHPGGASLALFLGIVPTALAYLLFARGLRRLSAAETATLTLAEPLTATLLGVIVLGETLSAPAMLGALLILGGLVVLAAPEVRRTATVTA